MESPKNTIVMIVPAVAGAVIPGARPVFAEKTTPAAKNVVPADSKAMDFQRKYMDLIFGFIGLTDVHSIIIEPTLAGGPDTADAKKKATLAEAQDLATTF